MAEVKRPVLKIPIMPIEKAFEAVSITFVFGLFIQLAIIWDKLPEKIPTHFNATGKIDAWGGKGSLIALPIVIAIIYGVMTLLSRFPHTFNYVVEITEKNAEFQYRNASLMIRTLKFIIIIIFTYMQQVIINSAQGLQDGMGVWFLPIFLILVFGDIAFFIVRMVKYR